MNRLKTEDFIYSFHDKKRFNPKTARKTHILKLNDTLSLCIERGDMDRARRTWAILIRCEEFSWSKKWRTALLLMSDSASVVAGGCVAKAEFLRKLMRQHPDEQEAILQEIILQLTKSNKFIEALEQLDSYLPSFPFQDNPVLHCYAGLISLQLAMQHDITGSEQRGTLLKRALSHFRQALSADPENVVANSYIEEISKLLKTTSLFMQSDLDDLDSGEEMDVDGVTSKIRTKRARRINEQHNTDQV